MWIFRQIGIAYVKLNCVLARRVIFSWNKNLQLLDSLFWPGPWPWQVSGSSSDDLDLVLSNLSHLLRTDDSSLLRIHNASLLLCGWSHLVHKTDQLLRFWHRAIGVEKRILVVWVSSPGIIISIPRMYLNIPIEYKIDSLFECVLTAVRIGEGEFPFKAIRSISSGSNPQMCSRYTKR